MKTKIEIKNRWTSKILFEFETKNNSILKTLKEAFSKGADLRGAYLGDADLGDADLRGANLRGAYLGGADLGDADLGDANLRGAYLGGADLGDADLGDADLGGANLRGANLRGAYLRGADLGDADLGGAYLRDADLGDADLRGANLRGADLGDADLGDADLRGAYLRGAYLGGDINRLKPVFWIVPEEGSFIAWKKLQGDLIAKLEIPAKAKRTSNLRDRKCRASYVKTLQILDGKNQLKEGVGKHDGKTIYKVGRLTKADSFDDDVRVNCTHGIHFFMTKQEALNWQ